MVAPWVLAVVAQALAERVVLVCLSACHPTGGGLPSPKIWAGSASPSVSLSLIGHSQNLSAFLAFRGRFRDDKPGRGRAGVQVPCPLLWHSLCSLAGLFWVSGAGDNTDLHLPPGSRVVRGPVGCLCSVVALRVKLLQLSELSAPSPHTAR